VALLLVVEDDPQVLVLAESVLKDAGHEVLTATNYDGAIALLADGNRPDLALIDHNLGEGLSGIDVAKSARTYRKDIVAIYTSGDHISDGTRALFVEGAEFLPKPYTPEALLEMVERLLPRPAIG
jgi:CheY-like chemotaxis protein